MNMDRAEQNLRTALTAGDLALIEAAEAEVDRVNDTKPAVTRHQAALWYVSLGLPVFPLQLGGKHPRAKCPPCRESGCPGPEACGHELCHGLKDATVDTTKINDWWTRWPQANVGLPTGHAFDVVDIDGPRGQKSRVEHWDDIFAKVDADKIAVVLTPRPGGMHVYVPPTGDSNTTEIVLGVDYRGLGGYVLAPPSVILPGGKDAPGAYRFLGQPNIAALSAAA